MVPWALAMLAAAPSAHADQPSCQQRSERAMQEGSRISGRTNLFRVVAQQGLTLHSAPSADCLSPQHLALKPGMDVIAYVVHHDYTAVLWNPPGATKPEVLWAPSTGLRALGYGIAPR
jgi:hypothetical protein